MKKKALTGIIFILSCFMAMFVLMEFHGNYLLVGITALVLLISSFFFLNALFAEKSKEWSSLKDIDEEVHKKESSGSNEADFKRNVVKYMEAMNKNQAQMLQELKSQKQLLKEEIKSLENEISSLAEKQTIQTKMVVKYNKENARQVALNEKKVVGQAVNELKEVMKNGMVVAPSVVSTEEVKVPVVEEMIMPEEVVELPKVEEMIMPEEVVELPKVEEMIMPEEIVELPKVEEMVIPEEVVELPKVEEMIIPEEVVELPKVEEMIIPEEIVELPKVEDIVIPEEVVELPKVEDIVIPEEMIELPKEEDIVSEDIPLMEDFDLPILDDIIIPEEKPVAPAVDSDPNKMMTPDDIAKLLASMGM